MNSQMQIVVPAAVAPGYAPSSINCAIASPAACAQGTLTLVIAAPQVAALNDTIAIPDTGGTLNVIANDTIDGVAAAALHRCHRRMRAALTDVFIVNANRVVVPAVPREYTITYRICSANVATALCECTTLC